MKVNTQYKSFLRALNQWIAVFQITDWTIVPYCTESSMGLAHTIVNRGKKEATIMYDRMEYDPAPEATALHEILHILLDDVLNTAETSEGLDRNGVSEKEHILIDRLVGALMSTHIIAPEEGTQL